VQKYGLDSTGCCTHGTERSDSTEEGNILDELRHYLPLKKHSASAVRRSATITENVFARKENLVTTGYDVNEKLYVI
jgi:hypothetical protein